MASERGQTEICSFLLQVEEQVAATSGHSPAPVSYTHLDVYKRQLNIRDSCGSDTCRVIIRICLSSRIIIYRLTVLAEMWVIPVSYTHLDVYKRQGVLYGNN